MDNAQNFLPHFASLLGNGNLVDFSATAATSLASVSYTHLDVYKRQEPIRPAVGEDGSAA